MIKAILTDIEGTISSIHFVKQVLFPYAVRAIPGFLRAHAGTPTVQALIADAAHVAGVDAQNLEKVIASLLQWIHEDRKLTPLKTLQGLVWEEGYRQGDYKAHLYQDAYDALLRWHQRGYSLYVYSSGSVHAQKLFFKYSECGDMERFFSGYFDTTMGQKRARESYCHIAAAVGLPTGNILFLSDIREELDAARGAGMCTCWLVRAQDTTATAADIATAGYAHVDSFAQIHPEEVSARYMPN